MLEKGVVPRKPLVFEGKFFDVYRPGLIMGEKRMAKPKVYVTRLLPREAMNLIRSSCNANVWEGELPPAKDVLIESVRDVEGLISLVTDKIDAEVMDRAPKLKIISNCAVGFDNIDILEATKRGIIVTNTPVF